MTPHEKALENYGIAHQLKLYKESHPKDKGWICNMKDSCHEPCCKQAVPHEYDAVTCPANPCIELYNVTKGKLRTATCEHIK